MLHINESLLLKTNRDVSSIVVYNLTVWFMFNPQKCQIANNLSGLL